MVLLIDKLLLGKQFSCVELDKHGAVSFEFLHWHGESEVIEKEELKFEIVELS